MTRQLITMCITHGSFSELQWQIQSNTLSFKIIKTDRNKTVLSEKFGEQRLKACFVRLRSAKWPRLFYKELFELDHVRVGSLFLRQSGSKRINGSCNSFIIETTSSNKLRERKSAGMVTPFLYWMRKSYSSIANCRRLRVLVCKCPNFSSGLWSVYNVKCFPLRYLS